MYTFNVGDLVVLAPSSYNAFNSFSTHTANYIVYGVVLKTNLVHCRVRWTFDTPKGRKTVVCGMFYNELIPVFECDNDFEVKDVLYI